MVASPAPVMLPDAVTVWREAIEALPAGRSPCRHMAPARWAEVRAACLDFLDRFGPEAARLGWTAPELFGVHPEHGTLRLDYCGVLMVNGRKADGLDEHTVQLGNQTARRDKAGATWGPPVWVFAAGRGR